MLCQLLGALCGAAIVYGNYVDAINIVEGGQHIRTLKTADLFGTIPGSTSSIHPIRSFAH